MSIIGSGTVASAFWKREIERHSYRLSENTCSPFRRASRPGGKVFNLSFLLRFPRSSIMRFRSKSTESKRTYTKGVSPLGGCYLCHCIVPTVKMNRLRSFFLEAGQGQTEPTSDQACWVQLRLLPAHCGRTYSAASPSMDETNMVLDICLQP